jgi:hypothetical protein
MNSNPINEGAFSGRIEATDDVEGHGIRGAAIVEPEPQDVEGHGAFTKHVDGPDTDEVEGHTVRIKGVVADDEDDDTEGHTGRWG